MPLILDENFFFSTEFLTAGKNMLFLSNMNDKEKEQDKASAVLI
ncbi:MAG: hypothetical protein CM1200mP30_27720 [Pseudomonadota bacterium]|nr:MAG: hypothetical protein CM1200mP30_27720 [Pseudomonadota bacterium]